MALAYQPPLASSGLGSAAETAEGLAGPLLVALVLAVSNYGYKLAFAALAIPAVVTLTLVLVARRLFSRPQDLSAGPAEVTTAGLPRCSGSASPRLRW